MDSAESPLERHFRRLIAADGPISLARYMADALSHPRHGYYARRDPFGAAGDFVTAPEISQMFGELVGLALAQGWLDQGGAAPVNLIEFGPGRGTLMADALRAAGAVPAFRAALRLHLIEASPALRAIQAARLAAARPIWHDSLDAVPDGPSLIVANEFFDVLPVRQFQRTERGWCEFLVALRADRLSLRLAPDPVPPSALPQALREAPPGAIAEISPAGEALAAAIGARIAAYGGLALIIDYGRAEQACGASLQAVRGHRPCDVLDRPGTADLSAHVDFAALAEAAARAGAACHGPTTQGRFLAALGIEARATALIGAGADRDGIAADLARLVAPDQMGSLFKVLAVTPPGAPPPAGFAAASA